MNHSQFELNKNQHQRVRNSQRGVGLVELIVALGVGAIVMLVLAVLFKDISTQKATQDANNDIAQLVNEISTILLNSGRCFDALNGQTITPPFNGIVRLDQDVDGNGTVDIYERAFQRVNPVLQVGGNYSSHFNILDIYLQALSANTGELHVVINKADSTTNQRLSMAMGTALQDLKFPVNYSLANNRIVTCVGTQVDPEDLCRSMNGQWLMDCTGTFKCTYCNILGQSWDPYGINPDGSCGKCGSSGSLPPSNCSAATISNCQMPSAINGVTISGSCSAGYAGACDGTCNAPTWNINNNTCAAASPPPVGTCGATTISNCQFPASVAPSIGIVGSCVNGYTGTCTANCTGGGIWNAVSSTCVGNCGATTIGTCQFPSGVNGATGGSCVAGYTVGSCSGTCAAPIWGSITNTCATPPPVSAPPPVAGTWCNISLNSVAPYPNRNITGITFQAQCPFSTGAPHECGIGIFSRTNSTISSAAPYASYSTSTSSYYENMWETQTLWTGGLLSDGQSFAISAAACTADTPLGTDAACMAMAPSICSSGNAYTAGCESSFLTAKYQNCNCGTPSFTTCQVDGLLCEASFGMAGFGGFGGTCPGIILCSTLPGPGYSSPTPTPSGGGGGAITKTAYVYSSNCGGGPKIARTSTFGIGATYNFAAYAGDFVGLSGRWMGYSGPVPAYTSVSTSFSAKLGIYPAMNKLDENIGILPTSIVVTNAQAVPLDITVSVSGQVTGSDYTIPSTSVTIPAGSTSVSFPITILNDSISESQESLIIVLNLTTTGTTVAPQAGATYYIKPSDPP